MSEQIKQRFSQLASVNISSAKLSKALKPIFILLSISIIIALVVVMMLWSGKDQYRPLYGEHEQYDQTQVITVLDQSGFDFYIEPKFGQVMVTQTQLGKARMALAAAGVKPQKPAGFEILAVDSSLGTSQFVENARYKHSLEGELARSIMTLDSIGNVRVHLAIPKQTLFVRRDKEQPSASVIISLLPGRQLQPQQVTAITNLVSGSVTGLDASRVNVIDQNGNLLSVDGPNNAQGSSAYLIYLESLEQTYIDRATKMLQPMMGLNNFQVEIAADINFDLIEATEELFNPDSVIRSEFSSFDRNASKDAAGIPGALSNQPPEDDGAETSTIKKERGENSREYVFDRTVKQIKYQQGALQRLSVSVLLNGESNAYDEAKINSLKAMLSNAIGLNVERGDSIALTVFPFNKEKDLSIAAEPNWWQQVEWFNYWKYLLSTIVAIAILVIVIRPLMRRISGDSNTPTDLIEISSNYQETSNDGSQLLTSNNKEEQRNDKLIEEENHLQIAKVEMESKFEDLPTTETGLEEQALYLQMLSEKEPERVAHIVKQWINQKNANS